MHKSTIIWLTIAVCLIVIGLLLFAVAMSAIGWDLKKLGTEKFETNTYEITQDFTDISVKTDTAQVFFAPSEDASCKVVCYEQKKIQHSVTVEDGTLTVTVNDERQWYEHIGIHFQTPKITVYLPQGQYSDLSIQSDTGYAKIPKDFTFENIRISTDTGAVTCHASAAGTVQIKTATGYIRVQDISAQALELTASTGAITVSDVDCAGDAKIKVSTGLAKLTDVTCNNLTSTGSTGSITLKNVIAAEQFSIERDTGSVKFDGCDAAEIFVETDTGSVTGTLLSDKVFFAETDTGSIDVPKSTSGGRCEVTTDTGSIKLKIQ